MLNIKLKRQLKDSHRGLLVIHMVSRRPEDTTQHESLNLGTVRMQGKSSPELSTKKDKTNVEGRRKMYVLFLICYMPVF